MIRLQPIIDVRELPPACSKLRQALPSLRSLVRQDAEPNEAKLLAYLRQGVVCGVYNDRGMVYDVLAARTPLDPDANLLLTDGTWIWPKALLHYLCEYHIRLPAALVEHAQGHDWQIDSSAIRLERLSTEAFDAPAGEVDSALSEPLEPQDIGSSAVAI